MTNIDNLDNSINKLIDDLDLRWVDYGKLMPAGAIDAEDFRAAIKQLVLEAQVGENEYWHECSTSPLFTFGSFMFKNRIDQLLKDRKDK